MASLHKQPNRPYWYCAFTTPDGKRHFKSTKTIDKKQARAIANEWERAAREAKRERGLLTPERIRDVIASGVDEMLAATNCKAKRISRKTVAASTVDNQQKDHLWTLARQVGNPVNKPAYATGWKETANPVGVPERIFIFTRDSRAFLLAAMPRKCHRRFVLIITLKGAGQICVDERIFRLDAGQAFLIFPFQFHHYISLQEGSIRWIFIMFDMVRADSLESLRNKPWHPTVESAQFLSHLLEAVSSRNSTRMIRATEAQLWLAQFLNQGSFQGTRLPSSFPTIFTKTQKWVERIHVYLGRHLNKPFKLEEMARGIGCSNDYLRHQFKEHFKISLGRYVAQRRINRAVNLLRENSLNISGVAQACGYSSLYAFSRKFRAAMGCSPRDYRIQIHKGNTGR